MVLYMDLSIGLKEYLIGVILVVLVIYYKSAQKKKPFPPGPRCLPIVGYAPFLGGNPSKTIMTLGKKYGPIFSLQLGSKTFIVLNSFDLVREALVAQSHIFSGRNSFQLHETFIRGLGIAYVDYGDFWKSQWKFGSKTLRKYGMGKPCLEKWIAEETEYLCELIRSYGDKAFDCQSAVSKAVSNIICRITMGKRFSYEDKRFSDLVTLTNFGFTDKLDGMLLQIMILIPSARFLPVFWGCYNRFSKYKGNVEDILQSLIKEHEDTMEVGKPRDFIDEFLEEILSDKDKRFNKEQLIRFLDDLFIGGTETGSSTLRWCFLALALNPQCQERIFKEIIDVIGEHVCPSMKHRDLMPFTCAFIHEITRHRTLVPMTLIHKTNEDVTLAGYFIPKDTPIIPHLWGVHNDPIFFKNPGEFCPERFVDENNRFVPSNHVIPFSIGPRSCIGEQLARYELFLFLTGTLQKFSIKADPRETPTSLNKGVYGVVYSPDKFNVIFSCR